MKPSRKKSTQMHKETGSTMSRLNPINPSPGPRPGDARRNLTSSPCRDPPPHMRDLGIRLHHPTKLSSLFTGDPSADLPLTRPQHATPTGHPTRRIIATSRHPLGHLRKAVKEWHHSSGHPRRVVSCQATLPPGEDTWGRHTTHIKD